MAARWPKTDWAFHLVPLLDGKARVAYVAMDANEVSDFDKVKEAILRKFEINPETYRQRFRKDMVLKNETPKELYTRLMGLYERWIRPNDKTKEEIGHTIVLEQFLSVIHPELKSWIMERSPTSAQHAIEMAEAFVAARQAEGEFRLAKPDYSRQSGDITQKGYEKKRAKLIRAYLPQAPVGAESRAPVTPSSSSSSSSRYQRRCSTGSRDERYHSDVHSEAVQAALERQCERKMAVPMPSKRRSLVTQSSMEAYTPPGHYNGDSSSCSDGEGSLGRARAAGVEAWISRALRGSSPSTTSSSSLQSDGSANPVCLAENNAHSYNIGPVSMPLKRLALKEVGVSLQNGILGRRSYDYQSDRPWSSLDSEDSHLAPPDITSYMSDPSPVIVERQHAAMPTKSLPKYGNAELMETGDGVPMSSRVSAKIQQLVNTLKRPKRLPLREYFVDDFEELLEVQQPDPSLPHPEGAESKISQGEELGRLRNCPASLEAALQRWGVIAPKAPCLTVTHAGAKQPYTLTYGKLWSRSLKLAYYILHKLGSKQEPIVHPGDRVALVYPNNDPTAFMVAFYGCLLAEVVPVPIEVPLTKKDAGSQQIGFLLGSCGVAVALTSDACYKGLPKTLSGDIMPFKGWPKLLWVVTDSKHLSKPPREWCPLIKDANSDTAYIEYKTGKDGSVLGVTVTRMAMLTHCQTLTHTCGYNEAETLVNVLDFKKDVGLWHGVLTSVLNMLHVVSVPYALMKVNPLSWIQKVCQYKGSVSSCDAFLKEFQSLGLRSEVICPCASSPEALTVAVRRPGDCSSKPVGRGILSMIGLSHGVIRVNTGEKLSVLTMQDVGTPMPGALVCVVKLDGVPQLCKTDEIGEICVSSIATGTSYYGLTGMSKNVFEVCPVSSSGGLVSECVFVRSGLLGFVGPGGTLFVAGKMDGLMQVGGRRHTADDIVATALAVEPVKFVYRGRIAVFSITVLHDERIVVVAEQRPDCTEDESFQWMSRVLQAIDSIHQVGVYCLALVPSNTLPKTPLGGIHLSETKQLFQEGALHPCNVLMCPHSCVTNLPKPRQKQPEVGPASVMVGNLVAGKRMAQASGRDLSQEENEQFLFLSEVLQWRAQTTPDHILYTLINSKGVVGSSLTCLQLHKRAEKIAALLLERGQLQEGNHVALVYPPGLDLVAAFYGCLYAGCIPITVRPPHPQNIPTTLPTVKMIVEVSRSACIVTTQAVCKLLKSKEASSAVDLRSWPPVFDTDDLPKRRPLLLHKPYNPESLAYLDFSVSTTGMLAGVKMSHSATSALCRSIKLQCELYPSREVAVCLDPYCGLGFVVWCLCSVYAGHQSLLIPPADLEVNPALWLLSVSQFKVRDTFCSYSVMELCTKTLGTFTESLKVRGLDLSRVRTCVVVAEERPRISLTQSFSKLFKDVGLHPRAVSTSFGCRVNLAVCLQGTSGPDPTTVYVDMRALRNDRVRLVERGSPHSLPLMESGKILPGVRIIIANPETKGPIGDSHLGEIWVHSSQNASGYFSVFGEENVHSDHFSARLSFGDTQTVWARTGYLGFLRRTELTDASGERHDALYVVGALDEAMELRGMQYHPIDVETSIIRTHKSITECAVFTWTKLLVVVVELDGSEQEALDLVPMVTNVVLEEHYLIVGVVVVVDTGVIPINSRGEKQRMHLRDGFLADQLDPIYVAYNM
ncbi:disco-interacting protein 2 homolog C isoform X3 [Trichomycterus rosablanca]|uniref:disco-interacting protein 2 homolog C isoform X3 n=1 Tax=Trichomycterus rosablanca TaxID=2290929 RepID=UPI002F35FC2B